MAWAGKVALVTGATGTVGERIVHRLLAEGMQVRALVRRPAAEVGLPGEVELRSGDLTDRPSVERAMAGSDLVVHSAAYIGADWDMARAANVTGTEHVLQAAWAARPERFVYLSTINVYDVRNRKELPEESPLWEVGPYAYHHTKTEAERLVQAAAKRLPTVILRPGAILSPHPSSTWGPLVVKRLAESETIRYHPEGILPWVHVENLVDMLMLAIQSPDAAGQAYNAVDGHVPFDQFHGQIAAWLGRDPVRITDQPPSQAQVYPGDKIRALGYSPRVTYDEAMAEIRDACREMGLLP
ncbi:MAG: NAD-dependent epimerase/dehydratase family protein [Bacillota bacterium]